MQNRYKSVLMAATTLAFLAACSDSNQPASTQDVAATVSSSAKIDSGQLDGTSPGKPSAPINFRYEVQGTPIVGQPVSVNLFVSSTATDDPISLSYRVNDASSMSFPPSQAVRAELGVGPSNAPHEQQITVIPQREGRLYLNVSAEIETADGTMIKTTSIPIQVGSAPPDLQTNGELIETADGETAISMPAVESD